MHFTLKFLILISICAFTNANDSKTTSPDVPLDQNKLRAKRQMSYVPTTTPVFFDAPPQQTGLLGLGGANIPIIGTLVSGLPVLGGNQGLLGGLTGQLGGLTSGLTGTLGNLGSGLGNLGQLGNLGGLGNLGLLGGSPPTLTGAASCPATQKLACRCEPFLPIKPLGTRRDGSSNIIEIENQRIKRNVDGSTETLLNLNNGIIMYQKSNNQMVSKELDGYYSLKVAEDRYLTIYYTINDLDYTVKADVNSAPPNTNLEIDDGYQNLVGSV